MIHLILGGARSGKSSYALTSAEQYIAPRKLRPVFIATATASDEEMRLRITRHKQERGDHWQLEEIPLALAERITNALPNELLLIDCLTLWLNNLFFMTPDDDPAQGVAALKSALDGCQADVVLIANEVGLGVIPMGDITRRYVDQAGWMNQALAAIADKVTFVAAGLPMTLKGESA